MAFLDAYPRPCSLSTPIHHRQSLQTITLILTHYRVGDYKATSLGLQSSRYCLVMGHVPCHSIADGLRKERLPTGLMKHLAGMRATGSCNLALAGETKAAISRHQMARGGDGCMVLSLQS